MACDHIRASDRDRDAVVTTLRDAFAEGRLTLDEFQERTTAAYAGRTWGALRELTTDLPVQPFLGADLPPEARDLAGAASAGALSAGAGSSAAYSPGALPGAGQPADDPPAGPHAFPGMSPADPSRSRPRPAALEDMPSERRGSGRPFGPVLPVVGMWVLFALATRSAGGAVAFIIAIALLVALSSLGRRPPRGPSGRRLHVNPPDVKLRIKSTFSGNPQHDVTQRLRTSKRQRSLLR